MSSELRNGEWKQGGRFLNDYSEDSIHKLIKSRTAFLSIFIWVSDDTRPGR